MWPAILFPIVCFAPESPWWLVRRGRLQDAERSVKRLSRTSGRIEPKQTVAMMVHTNNLEVESETGSSFLDCFKGVDLRRTEICCMANTAQLLSGFVMQGYTTYFFEQAGLAASNAFKLTVGQSGLAFVGTVLSWVLMGFFGRRTIYLYGLSVMTTLMFLIGFLALAPSSNNSVAWAQSIFLLLWVFFYDFTIGPIGYAIYSETSATRLRVKTIGIARNTYNIVSIINGIAGPYMLNPTEGNWKGKAGFLAGGLSLACFIWTYFRLPECKGRTYEELDIMFARGLSA